MTAPEAGWYPDENDETLARYWNGSEWTDDTRPRSEITGAIAEPIEESDDGDRQEGLDPPLATPDAPDRSSRLGDLPEAPARRGGRRPAWSTHPRTLISAFFVIAALLAGAVIFFSGDEASATEVTLEGAGSEGSDPFMDSIATDVVDPDGIEAGGVEEISTDPDQPVVAISGATPGLYGGTGEDAVCDPAALVEFLDANRDKARAFASVQGIRPRGIGDFVASLTPVLLREDTRVTNHGFKGGVATPLQSVLQAGTAVLVDDRGVPRVRCACGNPLIEPAGATADLSFTGETWAGFDDSRLVAVQPSPEPLDTLTITDIDTGDTQDVTPGTSGSSGGTGGVVLAPDGLGVVDFGASADDTFAALTEALGEPDLEGDVPGAAGNTNGQACLAGVEQQGGVRFAEWGRLRVAAGPTVGFYVWRFNTGESVPGLPLEDSDLQTPEGLGQGATRAEFEAAYPPVTAEDFPSFEGFETDAVLLTSPSGYEGSEESGLLFELAASSRPSGEVCGGTDGFRL